MSGPREKRLLHEFKTIVADLKENDMYYYFDDKDIGKGYGLMFGPLDSAYPHFPCVVSLDIPSEYPFKPPHVKFLTTDGRTRFHPNLYTEGKVCLSILGTFAGPSWSASLFIKHVLLSIKSLLDDKPYTHEPSCAHNQHYADYVRHNAMALTISYIKQTVNGHLPPILKHFEVVWDEHLKTILRDYNELLKVPPNLDATLNATVYGLPPVPNTYQQMQEDVKLLIQRTTQKTT